MKEYRKTEVFGATLALLFARRFHPTADALVIDEEGCFTVIDTENHAQLTIHSPVTAIIDDLLPDICNRTITLTQERLDLLHTYEQACRNVQNQAPPDQAQVIANADIAGADDDCEHFLDDVKAFKENDYEIYVTVHCSVCGKPASKTMTPGDFQWWRPASQPVPVVEKPEPIATDLFEGLDMSAYHVFMAGFNDDGAPRYLHCVGLTRDSARNLMALGAVVEETAAALIKSMKQADWETWAFPWQNAKVFVSNQNSLPNHLLLPNGF